MRLGTHRYVVYCTAAEDETSEGETLGGPNPPTERETQDVHSVGDWERTEGSSSQSRIQLERWLPFLAIPLVILSIIFVIWPQKEEKGAPGKKGGKEMKKILRRCLALGLSLSLCFRHFHSALGPRGANRPRVLRHTPGRGTDGRKPPGRRRDRKGTGALNADGTRSPAEQERHSPSKAGVGEIASNDLSGQPASYTLTLDLDGGQVNIMQNAGWNQSSYQTYQWTRYLTEAEAGQGVSLTLDGTLGGLLPGQPYRAGYSFTRWKIGTSEYAADQNQTVTLTEDTTIVAQWQIAIYTVSFQEYGRTLVGAGAFRGHLMDGC